MGFCDLGLKKSVSKNIECDIFLIKSFQLDEINEEFNKEVQPQNRETAKFCDKKINSIGSFFKSNRDLFLQLWSFPIDLSQ